MDDCTICVLGGGVVGLTTAIHLQSLNYRVVLVSRAIPSVPVEPNTSPKAGAFWRSFATPNDTRLQGLDKLTYEAFGRMVDQYGPEIGLCRLPVFEFWRQEKDVDRIVFNEYVKDFRLLSRDECSQVGMAGGFTYESININVPVYLAYLEKKFIESGGEIVLEEVRHIEDLVKYAHIVVNCSGIGARSLVEDPDVHPIKGQTIIVQAPQVKRTVLGNG